MSIRKYPLSEVIFIFCLILTIGASLYMILLSPEEYGLFGGTAITIMVGLFTFKLNRDKEIGSRNLHWKAEQYGNFVKDIDGFFKDFIDDFPEISEEKRIRFIEYYRKSLIFASAEVTRGVKKLLEELIKVPLDRKEIDRIYSDLVLQMRYELKGLRDINETDIGYFVPMSTKRIKGE